MLRVLWMKDVSSSTHTFPAGCPRHARLRRISPNVSPVLFAVVHADEPVTENSLKKAVGGSGEMILADAGRGRWIALIGITRNVITDVDHGEVILKDEIEASFQIVLRRLEDGILRPPHITQSALGVSSKLVLITTASIATESDLVPRKQSGRWRLNQSPNTEGILSRLCQMTRF